MKLCNVGERKIRFLWNYSPYESRVHRASESLNDRSELHIWIIAPRRCKDYNNYLVYYSINIIKSSINFFQPLFQCTFLHQSRLLISYMHLGGS